MSSKINDVKFHQRGSTSELYLKNRTKIGKKSG